MFILLSLIMQKCAAERAAWWTERVNGTDGARIEAFLIISQKW